MIFICDSLPGACSQMMESVTASVGSEDQTRTRGTSMFRTVPAKSTAATPLAATRRALPITGNGIREMASDPLSKHSRDTLLDDPVR